MGFYFRKRVRLGPLALNLSAAGIGLSTGVRGLRAGISSHGKLYSSGSIPGTGLYYRRYYRAKHSGEPAAHAAGFTIGAALPFLIALAIAAAMLVSLKRWW